MEIRILVNTGFDLDQVSEVYGISGTEIPSTPSTERLFTKISNGHFVFNRVGQTGVVNSLILYRVDSDSTRLALCQVIITQIVLDVIESMNFSFSISKYSKSVAGSTINIELTYSSHISSPDNVIDHLSGSLLASDVTEILDYSNPVSGINYANGSVHKSIESGTPDYGEYLITPTTNEVKSTDDYSSSRFSRSIYVQSIKGFIESHNSDIDSLAGSTSFNRLECLDYLVAGSDPIHGLFQYAYTSSNEYTELLIFGNSNYPYVDIYRIPGVANPGEYRLEVLRVFDKVMISNMDYESPSVSLIIPTSTKVLDLDNEYSIRYHECSTEVQKNCMLTQSSNLGYCAITSDGDILNLFTNEVYTPSMTKLVSLNDSNDYDYDSSKPLNEYFDFVPLNNDTYNSIWIGRALAVQHIVKNLGIEFNRIHLFDEVITYIDDEYLYLYYYSDFTKTISMESLDPNNSSKSNKFIRVPLNYNVSTKYNKKYLYNISIENSNTDTLVITYRDSGIDYSVTIDLKDDSYSPKYSQNTVGNRKTDISYRGLSITRIED